MTLWAQTMTKDNRTFEFHEGVTRTPAGIPEIDPDWVHANRAHLRVVDVRQPEELEGPLGGVAYAELVPMAEFAAAAIQWSRSQPLAILCRSGNRSATAARYLEQHGFQRVASVRGGMLLWNQLGVPHE